jgi:choice-of-anchor B domain-containing protein
MKAFVVIRLFSAMLMGGLATAREDAAFSASMYESGAVMHQIMEKKFVSPSISESMLLLTMKQADWAELERQGLMNQSLYPSIKAKAPCTDGKSVAIPGNARFTFRCDNVDLYDFKSHKDLGSQKGWGSSSWGWTSPEGREFIAVGQQDGAAFAEITSEGKLVYLGRLPKFSQDSIWREIRAFKNYMVIASEAEGHGIQIFDMNKLLKVDPASPKVFEQTEMTGHFTDLPVGRSHNIVVNEESNYVFSVGFEPRTGECRSGIIFINMTDPSNPQKTGCAPQAGYVHDAQCLTYKGPDTQYVNREICYGYNERNLVM